ncbi:glycosyltransferase [Silicimonas sp. MF1-12-2]|uniref:glycosyltransferase n=1 Tax=Silicimonas sp. MF1-12-2 TaxID=3384793 RepID=UPI0039B4A529
MTRNADEFVNSALSDRSLAGPTCQEIEQDHVVILMGLYNGATNIADQLRSYTDQSHGNWSLIISDDGSTDNGPNLVEDFALNSQQAVTLIKGPRLGFPQNFLRLLCAAGPSVPYAALSDQDDVWLPEKLKRALTHLNTLPAGRPALYAGRTIVCDAGLRPLRRSPLFELPPSFQNALVQCIGGGNTMVLNRAALDLVQETARHAKGIVAHDWWIYQIVSGAGGQVIYDPEPMVLYRQHGANMIGSNDTALASVFRVVQVFQGRYRAWNTANITALEAAYHWLSPQARQTLALFKKARAGNMRTRLSALCTSGVYRQTNRGNHALSLAALIKRI